MTPLRSLILITMATFALQANAAPSFRTQRLAALAKAIKLDLPEQLGINIDNDSTWNFARRTLRVRTNSWGDVSHVGYHLFDSRWAARYEAQPLLDYIERYALEQDAPKPKMDAAEEVSRQRISFVEGDVSMIRLITPQTDISIREQERRGYTVEWSVGQRKAQMLVPADYQLFTGANAIELEEIFERDICRIPITMVADTLPDEWRNATISQSDRMLIASNGSYLTSQIRSDLYLQKQGEESHLIIDVEKPLQSVNNILLTGHFNQEIPLDLTVDKYGYLKSKLQLTLQQFIDYCHREKCRLYIGIKTRTDDRITTTLFALNTQMAYNHTISLDFPLSILQDGTGVIKGTLYAYTPLQNITEKFFNNHITPEQP